MLLFWASLSSSFIVIFIINRLEIPLSRPQGKREEPQLGANANVFFVVLHLLDDDDGGTFQIVASSHYYYYDDFESSERIVVVQETA